MLAFGMLLLYPTFLLSSPSFARAMTSLLYHSANRDTCSPQKQKGKSCSTWLNMDI